MDGNKSASASGLPADLEQLLQQIGQPPTSPLYFPVRHHSPACARQLQNLMADYRPDLVLIEGPADATPLIPFLQDTTTRPPVAIYSYFVDAANRQEMNGELTPRADLPARFQAWYPFAAFSPELVALRQAADLGAEARFIDLPFKSLLAAEREALKAEGGKGARARAARLQAGWDEWLLARSSYVNELCRRTRSRDFNELWDHLFEVGESRLTHTEFRRQLSAWAYFSRAGYPAPMLEREGNTAREEFMAQFIAAGVQDKRYSRVLVVTGAFHTVALPGLVSEKLRSKVKVPKLSAEKDAASLLTPYSYYRMGELSGYASGVPAPQYYGRVWEADKLAEAEPHEMAGLSVLVEVVRRAKALGEPLSTADAIAAFHLARNLAGFRARPGQHPAREDFLDALQSSFIKGDASYSSQLILRLAAEVMTGEEVGEVTVLAGQAPLVAEFYATARKYRLPIVEGQPREISLDLYQNQGHATRSQFLHRLRFLGVTYASFVNGPDFVTGQNLQLITERWQVQWRPTLDGRLIELSAYGSTLAEAALNKLREAIARPEIGAGTAAALLLDAARMGLYEAFAVLVGEVRDKVNSDNNFLSLVDAAYSFVLLYGYREALVTAGLGNVLDLARPAFNRAVLLIPNLAVAKIEPDDLPDYADRFRTLAQLVLTDRKDAPGFSRLLLTESARRGLREADAAGAPVSAPLLRGALLGLLYTLQASSETEIVGEFEAYVRGNRGGGTIAGDFLDGLLRLSKGLLLGSRALLLALHELIEKLDWEDFVRLLPALRRAFTVYTPREVDLLAERVAALSGPTGSVRSLTNLTLPPKELIKLHRLDQEVNESLRKWGIEV
jgi:hypothetical protein